MNNVSRKNCTGIVKLCTLDTEKVKESLSWDFDSFIRGNELNGYSAFTGTWYNVIVEARTNSKLVPRSYLTLQGVQYRPKYLAPKLIYQMQRPVAET